MNLKNFAIIALLIGATFTALHCSGDAEGTNGIARDIAGKVTDVQVVTVQPDSFRDFIEVTGTVKADIATTVSAEEPGVIHALHKDKGNWVRQGEVVVALRSEVLQAEFAEAKAAYLLSKATFERQANLFEDNVISEQKYLEHKYNYERQKARFENLQARLDKTRIKSPVPGVIDNRLAEVGEYVMPGTPLFRVVKTDVVKIQAEVPERYLQNVRVGSTAQVRFDVLPGHEFTAKVNFVGPSINRSTRTFPIEIALANKEGLLKPEMFANIKITRFELDSVVVVSRDAIIETESGKYVFVASGNTAIKRPVELGSTTQNRVWIESGLQPGDQLIVVGHRDLTDGERIRIHE